MRMRSLMCVKVYYPRYSREHVIRALKEYFSKNAGKLGILEVYLFGSYARGDQTAFSDIDLLIVVEDGVDRDRLYLELRKSIDIRGLEPQIINLSDYLKMKAGRWIRTIKSEGVRIY